MNNESAKKFIEVEIKRILHEVHNDDLRSTIEINSRVTALEMAIEALERADKYRWHDLRVDKDDLPSEYDKYGVAWKPDYTFIDATYYAVIDYDSSLEEPQWNYNEAMQRCEDKVGIEVIAWRYVEPFEGGDVK